MKGRKNRFKKAIEEWEKERNREGKNENCREVSGGGKERERVRK